MIIAIDVVALWAGDGCAWPCALAAKFPAPATSARSCLSAPGHPRAQFHAGIDLAVASPATCSGRGERGIRKARPGSWIGLCGRRVRWAGAGQAARAGGAQSSLRSGKPQPKSQGTSGSRSNHVEVAMITPPVRPRRSLSTRGCSPVQHTDTLGAKAHKFTPGRVRNPGCADRRIRTMSHAQQHRDMVREALRPDHRGTRRNQLTIWGRR